MKKLFILRHAEAVIGFRDVERPLSSRGKNDVAFMGKKLYEGGILPDLILTSSAGRTRMTAQYVAEEIGYKKKLTVDNNLYLASVAELENSLVSQDDNLESIMIVGHNPGLTEFINLSSDGSIINLPPCGFAVIEYPVVSWRQIGSGRLVKILDPAGLR